MEKDKNQQGKARKKKSVSKVLQAVHKKEGNDDKYFLAESSLDGRKRNNESK